MHTIPSLSHLISSHVSAGVSREVAGRRHSGVKLVLAFLRLVVQEVGQPFDAHECVVVCLEQVLEVDMPNLRRKKKKCVAAKGKIGTNSGAQFNKGYFLVPFIPSMEEL